MALPKLKIPEYELVVPSTQEKIKYRPFLVREEKILLMALENDDQNSVSNALSTIVTECTFGNIDGETAPVFDAEYIFLQMSVDHTNEIELTDDIKMFMKYPTLSSLDGFDEKDETESTLKMMQSCVDEIHFGDDVYRKVDISKKELDEFFGSLTSEMLAKVQEFFETMPKLRHIIDVKNPKTKKKNEVMLEGLGDFFT